MITQIRYINTLQGHVQLGDEHPAFLIHEHLFQNLTHRHSPEQQVNELSLSTIDAIRNCPFSCLDNLTLNSVEQMAHELKLLDAQHVFVLEATNLDNGRDIAKLLKLNEMVPRLSILVGYSNPLRQPKPDTKENQVLHSKEQITKKLTLEINLGSGGIKPAFIGEIVLDEIDLSHWMVRNYLESYFEVSRLTRIPVLLSLNQDLQQFYLLKQKYSLEGVTLLLVNPPIRLKESVDDEQLLKQVQVGNYDELRAVLENPDVSLVFDAARYREHWELARMVVGRLGKERRRVYSSVGVSFKSDLRLYGGKGFAMAEERRGLEVFEWAVKEMVVEEKKKWECPQCQQQFDEDIEKFKKMDQEFCSMKCLRQGISRK